MCVYFWVLFSALLTYILVFMPIVTEFWLLLLCNIFLKNYLLILERKRVMEGGKRERLFYCTYLCIHWLTLECALVPWPGIIPQPWGVWVILGISELSGQVCFVIYFEIREGDATSFVLLSQDCFGYFGFYVFLHKLYNHLFYCCEKCQLSFDRITLRGRIQNPKFMY